MVVTGGLDKVFCSGANIQMLASATHGHKVNFCKFTNETRNGIEDATANSGQTWIAAVNGTAAGGGYELALACDEIVLVDDRASAVSLPEVPLLAVLPGTGGLTRLVDKRHVRRDRADVFATKVEGIKGAQAVEWGLVDVVVPRSRFDDVVRERSRVRADASDRPLAADGLVFTPLTRTRVDDEIRYSSVTIALDRSIGVAHITISAPSIHQPVNPDELAASGAGAWIVSAVRELDDAILHLRFNEPEIGTWVFHTRGDQSAVLAAEALLEDHADHWLVREVRLYWARTFKRLDVSSRTLIALIEPGSCFAGTLAELALAADRTLMLDGTLDDGAQPAPMMRLSAANDGWYPMVNGLSRLATRFWRRDDALDIARAEIGKDLLAVDADRAGLVTFDPRRHRLARRGALGARGAQQLLARRAQCDGGEPAIRRAGDDGDQDLRSALGLAELGVPTAERGRTRWRVAPLRHGCAPDVRQSSSMRSRHGLG